VIKLLFVLVVLVLAVAVLVRATLFSSLPSRRARWRIRFRLKPAPGFASFAELAFRWSRLAAVVHGRRVRPDLAFWARLFCPVTWYAWRLGRAQYFKRVFAPQEHQTAIIAPPRVGKSGFLGEWMLSHRGACVSFTTRADLYELTAGTRAQLGPLYVFNPYGVAGIPSTFRPDIIAGCLSAEVAVRRAAALIGETSMMGEMVFWSDKAAVALAGLMHAAAVGGHDMAKVYLWANRAGETELAALARRPGASRELFAGLAEIYADTKAASSIRMTLLRSLGWLAVPELRDMVCGPEVREVDAGEFAATRSTLYMILRDGSSSVAAPLFRLICDLMHHEGNLAATRTRWRRHVPGVFFAVDEVANIGLPKLAQKLADSAGFGSFMAIVVHSVAQLREAYSPDAAGAILACCGTKIIMPGLADADTLEDLSVLCGTIPSGESTARVVMPEVIGRLPANRALVLHANLSPLVVKFRTPWRRWSYRLGRLPLAPRPLPPAVPELVPQWAGPELEGPSDAAA
jgi:type IV secretion system protein VirD4